MNLHGALQHLASECGELTQAAIKYIQHGPRLHQPERATAEVEPACS